MAVVTDSGQHATAASLANCQASASHYTWTCFFGNKACACCEGFDSKNIGAGSIVMQHESCHTF